MPSRIERHNILLSCPGDVDRLVPTVFKALHNFNEHYGDSHQIELHGRHWSRDMYPKSGGKPQDLINEIIVPNCDAAIAIFWCSLGSPTDKYESGTVEEIEQMLDMERQVFLYFSKENPPYSVAEKGIDARIADFKKRYKDRGVYFEFSTEEELSKLLSAHLRLHFIDHANAEHDASDAMLPRTPLPRLVGVVNGRISSTALYQSVFLSPRQQDAEEIRGEIRRLLTSTVERYAKHLDKKRESEEQKTQMTIKETGPTGFQGALANLDVAAFNAHPGFPVAIEDNTKRIIQKIAEAEDVDLPEGFLTFKELSNFTIPLNGGTQYYGPWEEERRYRDIMEIESKISEFCLWKSAEEAYGELSNAVLALENAGTAPDEDIDVYLSFPTDALILPNDIPRQDDHWLSMLEDKVGLSDYFAPRIGLKLQEYSESDLHRWTPREIRGYGDAYAVEELLNCFPYDFEEDGETTTVRLHFSQIKQHTAIAFPTPIFLTSPINSIPYEIISRGVGDVVRGVLDVTRENH